MRKLWPFLGIALAVALGIALAPYTWRIIGLGAAAAILWLALGVVWIGWQYVRRGFAWCWRWYLDSTVESPPL